MRNKEIKFIIAFLLFIYLPAICNWFLKPYLNTTNYEKRKLNEKPVFEAKRITFYPSEFEAYYNDNLPFKNEIRIIRSRVLYDLFNISSTDSVIIGNDGWLFYNGVAINDSDPINQYRNNKYDRSVNNEIILEKIISTNELLKKNNIDFYLYVIPNKENVYEEKIKTIINKNDNLKNKTDLLVNKINSKSSVNVIYSKESLIDNKNNLDTFQKYDSHWNDYGAFIGSMDLITAINSDFEVPDIKIGKKNQSGDLAFLLMLNDYLKNDEPVVNNYLDDIDSKCSNKYINYDDKYISCSSNNPIYNKNILIVGDSFRSYLVKYFSKVYKNTIIVERNTFNKDMIESNDIDIFVYESVERYIDDIPEILDKIENEKEKEQ